MIEFEDHDELVRYLFASATLLALPSKWLKHVTNGGRPLRTSLRCLIRLSPVPPRWAATSGAAYGRTQMGLAQAISLFACTSRK